MADIIQQRRDTAARWAQYNPILLEGEVGYVTDNPNQYKIGNGRDKWNDLPLRGYTGTITQDTGDDENAVMSQKAVTDKLSELGSEVGLIDVQVNGSTIIAENLSNWEFTEKVYIPKGSVVENKGIIVALYTDKDAGEEFQINSGAKVTTEKDFFYVRAWTMAGNIHLEVKSQTNDYTDKAVENVEKTTNESLSDIEKRKKNITNTIFTKGRVLNGKYTEENGFIRTSALPVIDGYGYYAKGTYTYISCSLFSDIDATESSYIGYANNAVKLPENTKSVVFSFKEADIELVEDIVSIKELNDLMLASPFRLKRNNIFEKDLSLEKLMNLCLFGINSFFFHGSLVDTSKEYSVWFLKTGTKLRVIILDGDVRVLDSSVTQVIGTPYIGQIGNDEYAVDIVCDFANLEDISDINDNRVFLSDKAFSSLQPLTKPDFLNLLDCHDGTEEIDLSSYFEESNGATDGYVLTATGVKGSASDMTVTDYIPTEGLLFLNTNTPYGSGAGLAFYDNNKNALTNYQGTGNAGFGSNYQGISYLRKWKEVPKEASFFRTSVRKSDEPYLIAIKQKSCEPSLLLDKLGKTLQPKSTKVIWGYENFNMPKSRVIIEQQSENEEARQIQALRPHYLNRSNFEISFTPNSSDVFIGIGCEYDVQSEMRVRGNMFSVRCGSSAQDTYLDIEPRVIFEEAMPFSIVSGKTYKMGYIKRDASKNGEDYLDNVTFFVEDSDGSRYEKTIERTASSGEYNGVSGGYSTMLIGTLFISVKKGSVMVNNVCFSSDYEPRVKAILTGDSFAAGFTMITEGQRYKYSALIQQKVGMNDFAIVAKGGEEVNEDWEVYMKAIIEKMCPQYVIVSLGANNQVFSVYRSVLLNFISWLESVGVIPVLTTVAPYKNGTNLDSRKDFRVAANEWIKTSGYRYVDVNAAVTTSADGSTWVSEYVKADGVHPTKEGHKAIFDAFVQEIPEIFAM